MEQRIDNGQTTHCRKIHKSFQEILDQPEIENRGQDNTVYTTIEQY